MERIKCPICNVNVVQTSGKTLKHDYIVHENENYTHFQRNGKDYLIRSALNIQEEMGTLVLN